MRRLTAIAALLFLAAPSLTRAQHPDVAPLPLPTREALLAEIGPLSGAVGATFEPTTWATEASLAAQVRVTIGVAPGDAWAMGARQRLALIGRCIGRLTGEQTVAPQPWDDVDARVAGLPLVMIQIAPYWPDDAQCVDSSGGALDRSSRKAARKAAAASLSPATDVDSIEVRADGHPLIPLLYVRRGHESRSATWHQVRAYLSPAALAPDSAGRVPSLEITVHRAGREPSRVPVSAASTLAAWEQLVAVRLVVRHDGATGPMPSLPVPHDTVLRAIDAAPSDDAARRVARRRTETELVPDDSAFVALRVAHWMRERGDDAGAAAEMRGLLQSHPCLGLPAGLNAAQYRLAERVRPAVRCSVVPPRRLTAALLVPGAPDVLAGRRWLGAAEAALSTVLLLRGAQLDASALDAHRAYLRATAPLESSALLDRANGQRRQARTYLVAGASAWLVSATRASIAERRHARAVTPESAYGSRAASRGEVVR